MLRAPQIISVHSSYPAANSPPSIAGLSSSSFFFNDTATTEIYTLSLHDALPIYQLPRRSRGECAGAALPALRPSPVRSEEHTSELQSPMYLVCRLLLEKKKKKIIHLFPYKKKKKKKNKKKKK